MCFMTSFVTLRQATVGVALIVALAACGSAAAPTSLPTGVATAAASPVATAIPTAAPTATPAPTVESGLSWKYTRTFVAKSFTDKFGLVFTQEPGPLQPGRQDPTWVDSPRRTAGKPDAAYYVSVRGAAASGDSLVVTVYVQVWTLAATSDKAMVFALQLMTDSNVTAAALDWLNSEFAKANADKNTVVDETMTFGSASLLFHANDDYGNGTRGGPVLNIHPATSPFATSPSLAP
jgi:hypothetical protein